VESPSQEVLDQVEAETTAALAAQETVAEPAATETVETEAQQEQAPQTAAELARSFRVKVRGEEIEVPIYDESGQINRALLDRYSMGEDYTRKTQELAREKQMLAQLRQQEQEKYEQRMQELMERVAERLNPTPQEPDPFAELPQDDPYVKMLKRQAQQQQELMQRIEQAQQIIQKQGQFIQRDFSERQMKQQEMAVAEAERQIKTAHPDFDDTDIIRVETDYLRQADAARKSGQAPPSIHDVAMEYAKWINAKAELALNRFKETTKLAPENSPAAKVGGSKTPGPKGKKLSIEDGSILEAALEEERNNKKG
jgi:hypothetical protein